MEFLEPETEQRTKSKGTDDKTDKMVNELGDSVEKIYSGVESEAKQGWTSLSGFWGNFQKSLPDLTKQGISKTKNKLNNDKNIEVLKEKSEKVIHNVSDNTSKMLDTLDSHLEKVESVTYGYATHLTTLFKARTGLNLDIVSNTDSLSSEKESEVLFNLPKGLASNRVEAQMHELQTNKDGYLKKFSNEGRDCLKDYELKEEEIEEKKSLLETKNSPVAELYKELVPESLDDEFFWKYYFSTKGAIIGEEKRRKELLKKSAEEEEEDFKWDDDE
ncbi:hypothetical protein FOA43_004261 [Brettanomyces nanus]|uniref:BSD domain-containing protein n=1 Tax=Eeniella nana TaxID=13502 RepID=A0A875RXG4_EENNA|nr:uncharacterized protein FOA43_004261 [Brettanomyces nanus]QPG76867.1 hypothetical protein FOA43_004261 [Brettanomyces nanus]